VKLLPLTEMQIAQRAYEIWQRDGKVHGKHEEQWCQAIEELNAEVIFEIISDSEDVSSSERDIE